MLFLSYGFQLVLIEKKHSKSFRSISLIVKKKKKKSEIKTKIGIRIIV